MFLFNVRVCFSLPEAFEVVVVWFCRVVGTVVGCQTWGFCCCSGEKRQNDYNYKQISGGQNKSYY